MSGKVDVRLLSPEQVLALMDNAETLDRARTAAAKTLLAWMAEPAVEKALASHPELADLLASKLVSFIYVNNEITKTADAEVARILGRAPASQTTVN